jgi:hypothetical protein
MAMGGGDEFSALLVSLRQVAMVTARVLLARPANQVPAGNAHLSGAVLPNVRAFPVVSLMTLESFRGETLGWFSSPMPSCWRMPRGTGNFRGDTVREPAPEKHPPTESWQHTRCGSARH